MDPISTAIIAAVTAGVTETGKKAFTDAYQGLKRVIQSKFGKGNNIDKAIAELEQTPASKGRQMVLAETMALEKADKEADVLVAAEKLKEMLKQAPGGNQHIMKARGNFIFQADRGSSITIK